MQDVPTVPKTPARGSESSMPMLGEQPSWRRRTESKRCGARVRASVKTLRVDARTSLRLHALDYRDAHHRTRSTLNVVFLCLGDFACLLHGEPLAMDGASHRFHTMGLRTRMEAAYMEECWRKDSKACRARRPRGSLSLLSSPPSLLSIA
jgi:hypothetical protein